MVTIGNEPLLALPCAGKYKATVQNRQLTSKMMSIDTVLPR